MLLAVRLICPPTHTGELEDIAGAAGIGLMVRVVVAGVEVQLLTVIVSV
jgi:hypothetical protein